LMKNVRQAIIEDRLGDFRNEFFGNYGYIKKGDTPAE
jgi:queuine tRNA-ribosyltransferase